MYLKEDAIDAVVTICSHVSVGKRDRAYILTQSSDPPSSLSQRVANLGEPWVSCFEPDALEAKLLGAGFSKVEFLTPEEVETRYFRQRPKDLPVPKKINILCAVK